MDQGYSIADLRQKNGFSPKELANRLNVDVQEVQAWESGKSAPTATQLASLAAVFSVPIHEIRIEDTART